VNDSTVLKAIFERVESTVIATGDRKPRTRPIRDVLREEAGNAAMTHTDADYFQIMVHVIFYAGMKATIVTKRESAIDRHFSSFSMAAGYGEKDILAILADPQMLRNKLKIRGCIDNAKKFAEVVKEYGSFGEYLRSIASVEDLRTGLKGLEDLRRLWIDLQGRFKFLGRITSFHYLMEVGYNLVKPDRVVTRIFSRLRLIDGLPSPDHPDPQKLTDEQLWQIVQVGQQIAESSQLPIRYVDLVFVVFGQMEGQNPEDLPQGICLDENPRCSLCGVRDSCRYEPKTLSATA
jgi:DNA-3-methyladenine glycosylase I